MPRGYRRVIFAAVCGLAIAGVTTGAYFIGLADGQGYDQKAVGANQRSAEASRQPQQADTHRAGLPGFIERAISNPEPQAGDDHEKRDLAAQEASATFAFWVVVAAFVQAAASIVGIVFIIKTLQQGALSLRTAFSGLRQAGRAARAAEASIKIAERSAQAAEDTVKEARRIGEAQVRCYLSGVKASIGYTNNGTVVTRCSIKNSGQSVAKGVRCTGKLNYFQSATAINRNGELIIGFAIFEVDIPSGGEEDVQPGNFILEFTDAEMAAVNGVNQLLVTLEITITAIDVFGLPVTEIDKFTTMRMAMPNVAAGWIDLRRAGRIRLPVPGANDSD